MVNQNNKHHRKKKTFLLKAKEINELFINTVQNLNLKLINKRPTRNHNTLDLFLTNRPGLVIDHEINPGLSDHDIVRVNNRIKTLINKKT